jgi:hypothetical protein
MIAQNYFDLLLVPKMGYAPYIPAYVELTLFQLRVPLYHFTDLHRFQESGW